MSRSSPSKLSATRGPKRLLVVPDEGGGWQVRGGDAGGVTGIYRTQEEATAAAHAALRRSGGQLQVVGRNGQVRESTTLGRDPMEKIAAVEGIRLSAEMKRTLATLDRQGASGDERRRTVAAQFGKKR